MSTEFIARNGFTVSQEDGYVDVARLKDGFSESYCEDDEVIQALREFFLHEAGVEVDPEDSNLHWYSNNDESLLIVRSNDASIRTFERDDIVYDTYIGRSAQRYFALHPKEEPKPWLEAAEGELWEITYKGISRRCFVDSAGVFMFSRIEFGANGVYKKHSDITAGKRLYPAEEALGL